MQERDPNQDAPYELRSERLVVRCWQPADAALLKDAVDTSLEHLRPWMDWAYDEPQPIAQKVHQLRRFRGAFDLGDDFVYGIFDATQQRALGGAGLHHRRGPGSLEIGYWVRADAARQGIASETVRMLARAAFDVCLVERLDVLVEPANEASAAIPRRLGFVEEGRARRQLPPARDGEHRRDALVFTMTDDEYREGPLREFAVRAFDVLGDEIELP